MAGTKTPEANVRHKNIDQSHEHHTRLTKKQSCHSDRNAGVQHADKKINTSSIEWPTKGVEVLQQAKTFHWFTDTTASILNSNCITRKWLLFLWGQFGPERYIKLSYVKLLKTSPLIGYKMVDEGLGEMSSALISVEDTWERDLQYYDWWMKAVPLFLFHLGFRFFLPTILIRWCVEAAFVTSFMTLIRLKTFLLSQKEAKLPDSYLSSFCGQPQRECGLLVRLVTRLEVCCLVIADFCLQLWYKSARRLLRPIVFMLLPVLQALVLVLAWMDRRLLQWSGLPQRNLSEIANTVEGSQKINESVLILCSDSASVLKTSSKRSNEFQYKSPSDRLQSEVIPSPNGKRDVAETTDGQRRASGARPAASVMTPVISHPRNLLSDLDLMEHPTRAFQSAHK